MPIDPYKRPISFTDQTLELADEMATEDADNGKSGDRSAFVRGLILAEAKRRKKISRKSRSLP